ncbi:MAG: LptF/LptG family permease [Chlamydiales bacterium]|nr:LptF/LptG family permease [Chlamydiales bacterium]
MIWKKYIFKELAKVFFLFIGGFYFLYVLIDYSTHTKAFHKEGVGFLHTLIYYLLQFSNRAEILVPIALLIATVKVLTTLNMRNEVVALLSGGIAMKKLMRPFLFAAALAAALLYLNFQFIQPLSFTSLSAFEGSYFKQRSEEQSIGALTLTDSSVLIYQKYDPETQSFFDAYWYKNHDLIYRIQQLYPYDKIPLGKKIDLLRREDGRLKRMETFETLTIPEIRFSQRALYSAIHPPRSQSLTQLFSNHSWSRTLTDKEAETASVFLYKLTIPLASLLVVIAPAPFCLRFGRSLPVYLIYALSLFGIITFFTFVNSCVILGESQVIPPLWALLAPLTLFFGFFGWNYHAKL